MVTVAFTLRPRPLQVHAILEATTHGGDKTLEGALFSHADAVTTKFFGNEIYYRGIVEFSNVCQNDCGYCGIRKHISGVKRCGMGTAGLGGREEECGRGGQGGGAEGE